MSYNYVNVSWEYESAEGTARIGRVEWYPTGPIVDGTNNITFDMPPQTITLDTTGKFTVRLLATDNAGLSSFGWLYVPYVGGEEHEPVAYQVKFADGANQNLDDLDPYVAP